jgi:hypothetical protein
VDRKTIKKATATVGERQKREAGDTMNHTPKELVDALQKYMASSPEKLDTIKPATMFECTALQLVRQSRGPLVTQEAPNESGEVEKTVGYFNPDLEAMRMIYERMLGKPAVSSDISNVAPVDLLGQIDADPDYAANIIRQEFPGSKSRRNAADVVDEQRVVFPAQELAPTVEPDRDGLGRLLPPDDIESTQDKV